MSMVQLSSYGKYTSCIEAIRTSDWFVSLIIFGIIRFLGFSRSVLTMRIYLQRYTLKICLKRYVGNRKIWSKNVPIFKKMSYTIGTKSRGLWPNVRCIVCSGPRCLILNGLHHSYCSHDLLSQWLTCFKHFVLLSRKLTPLTLPQLLRTRAVW